MASRREFMQRLGVLASSIASSLALPGSQAAAADGKAWKTGRIRHILPAVTHQEMPIKISVDRPLKRAPVLMVDDRRIVGEMTDTGGLTWQFHADGLAPDRRYRLALKVHEKAHEAAGGKRLCDDWVLSTFPAPEAEPARVRVLFFTCAGGHEKFGYLPVALRRRLLRRALAFSPDAAVANGDHVYWDLRSPRTSYVFARSPLGLKIGGKPDRSKPVLGTANEAFLKKTAGPQIVPVYGADFRSTPVYFIQDDHDYYDNDEATDRIVTFPPDRFMRDLARTTQRLYYPAFLPDAHRPAGLPGAIDGQAGGSREGRTLSQSFGTLRYGRLLEALLYSVRPTMTLSGPKAVFLDRSVETWLQRRMAATGVRHVVNVPSNPPGWTAGKWGEWYPDRLTRQRKQTLSPPKRFWQSGWLKQHDRLLAAMSRMKMSGTKTSGMKRRLPLVISGDLHATAMGRITRTGKVDLSANPVVAVLSGTIGTGTRGWPSRSRGMLPRPSLHLAMDEVVKPIEQHGFTLVDFTPETVTVRLFKWDRNTQPPAAIETLEPFRTFTLSPPR